VWVASGVVLLSALLASGGPHLHWFLSTVFSRFWMDVSSRLNPTIVISTAEHMHIGSTGPTTDLHASGSTCMFWF
jgi:hypothetical protein